MRSRVVNSGVTSAFWLLVCLPMLLAGCAQQPTLTCSPNWKITGYYVPRQQDFPATPTTAITIAGFGTARLASPFLQATKLEGWGRLQTAINGYPYLGFYSGGWHLSHSPKNSLGGDLAIGQVAADNTYLSEGTTVTIPVLTSIFNQGVFKVADRGSAIGKRHIDIYTGEGEAARALSYRVTHASTELCL
ncbi:3D domain-containing protein [Halioxenophilus sp. WMMB6]|uniref:3D domain-containing protein n=1 Tax=Halioxenophilus sp. WMMB6 TaxID=3073815 RepID=UPI00295E2875|nr:3D domain-containing protein [Halioxenophilus sp. WMMB6]